MSHSTRKSRFSKRKRMAREKMRRQKSVWEKVSEKERFMGTVFCFCGIFMLYGMTDEILGPTLIELSCMSSTDLTDMSWLFFSHDLGLLLGTICGGLVLINCDPNLTMALCLFGNAMSVAIIPILHNIGWMMWFVCSYGLFLGIPDTLSNVVLIKIFGKEVAPYIQGVHFFYGLGAFISPLVARPFLRPTCKYTLNTTHFVSSDNLFNTSQHNVTFDDNTGIGHYYTVQEVVDTTSDVKYAYWVISISHIPVVFGLAWLYFQNKIDERSGKKQQSTEHLNECNITVDDGESVLDLLPYNPELGLFERIKVDQHTRLVAVTALSSIIIYLFEGLMAVFGGYLYSYSVSKSINMSSDDAAYLTSFYWGFFSLGRFVSIILAFIITPKGMLLGNATGCLLSTLILIVAPGSSRGLWIGSCTLGLFLSSAGPTIIAMAEQYVELTDYSTSMLVIASALGELTMPVLVGQMFDKLGPFVVPVTAFTISFLGFVGYFTLLTFDNDKAYAQANTLWKLFCAFWCCSESQPTNRPGDHRPASSSSCCEHSAYTSCTESAIDDDSGIPTPVTFMDKVQPGKMSPMSYDTGISDEGRRETDRILKREDEIDLEDPIDL